MFSQTLPSSTAFTFRKSKITTNQNHLGVGDLMIASFVYTARKLKTMRTPHCGVDIVVKVSLKGSKHCQLMLSLRPFGELNIIDIVLDSKIEEILYKSSGGLGKQTQVSTANTYSARKLRELFEGDEVIQ